VAEFFMPVSFEVASSQSDLNQILDLQQMNHATALSAEDAARDGFVTVKHTLDLLTKMNSAAPQVIAKDKDAVVGYALVMLRSFESMIPVLQPMFERLSGITHHGKRITDHTFYVMGQICVDANYRGQGVFDGMYLKHRELYSRQYDLCATSVAIRNHRSMRAHERDGIF
jgi:ribosomal protein S18 acetylase RimI-like enzyme